MRPNSDDFAQSIEFFHPFCGEIKWKWFNVCEIETRKKSMYKSFSKRWALYEYEKQQKCCSTPSCKTGRLLDDFVLLFLFRAIFFYLVKKSQLFLWNIDKWIEMLGSHWFGRFGLTVMQKWSWTWNMQSSISMLIRFNWLNIFQFALHVSHMFQGY